MSASHAQEISDIEPGDINKGLRSWALLVVVLSLTIIILASITFALQVLYGYNPIQVRGVEEEDGHQRCANGSHVHGVPDLGEA